MFEDMNTQHMEIKTLDLRHLQCPEPVKVAKEELDSIKEGNLIILVKSPSNWNIERLAKKSGLKVSTTKHQDHYELNIIKTPYAKPQESAFKKLINTILRRSDNEEKDVMLIIGSDTIGKEDDIGYVLTKGFFETMKVTGEIPHTIFFLNAGVKLTTINLEVLPILKDIEDMGVEIFSCGTCLRHYGLEDELKVGYRGTTSHIVEGIKDFKKVVWI